MVTFTNARLIYYQTQNIKQETQGLYKIFILILYFVSTAGALDNVNKED